MAGASDRTFRSLAGLEKTASTSRVLNLAALSARHGGNPEHVAKPMLAAPALHGALLVRHRLRPMERDMFDVPRYSATKLIIPFERSDLALGGRSMFIGERNWYDQLESIRGTSADIQRDIAVLQAVDELPSLDPFLLREHLKRRGFEISATHFEISLPDLALMNRFVATEVTKLIQLAYVDQNINESIGKLVDVLLTSTNDQRLEPLRLAMGLDQSNYREGIFAWRGFLFYKWMLNRLWSVIRDVLQEIAKVRAIGALSREMDAELRELKARVVRNISRCAKSVMQQLSVYDDVFAQLTVHRNPGVFKEFLLSSPDMFLSLGEGCGLISHISSYWRYRFANGQPLRMDPNELLELLYEFDASLAAEFENSSMAA